MRWFAKYPDQRLRRDPGRGQRDQVDARFAPGQERPPTGLGVGRRRVGARSEDRLHGVAQMLERMENIEDPGRLRDHVGGQLPNPLAAAGRGHAQPIGFAAHAFGEEFAPFDGGDRSADRRTGQPAGRPLADGRGFAGRTPEKQGQFHVAVIVGIRASGVGVWGSKPYQKTRGKIQRYTRYEPLTRAHIRFSP